MSKGKEYNKFIHSVKWLRLRRRVLTEHPLCQRCEAEGITRAATEVHHVHPVEDALLIADQERLMFDRANLQALCHDCHVKAHMELGRTGKKQAKRRTQERLKDFCKKFLC